MFYLRTGNCVTYGTLRVIDANGDDLLLQVNRLAVKVRELHLLAAAYNIFPGWAV
jgi:hypothetical protein